MSSSGAALGGRFKPGTEGEERSVERCNFRSAGQLSNESARVLTSLYETLARNVMNTLDVYLGASLDLKLRSLHQLSMDEYRARVSHASYLLPCELSPSSSTMLLEMEDSLQFTMVDLLLGGGGAQIQGARELTEIDEEVMQGVGALIAQQVERIWRPIGIAVKPGSCTKPSLAHKLFPPMEKVLVVEFELGLAGVSGALSIVFPASLGGHLVRNIKADVSSSRGAVRYFPRLSLEERILDCKFATGGSLPAVRVPVRSLTALAVGDVFLLPASVESPARLTLEGRDFFEAAPVRSGNLKAVQLLAASSSNLRPKDEIR